MSKHLNGWRVCLPQKTYRLVGGLGLAALVVAVFMLGRSHQNPLEGLKRRCLIDEGSSSVSKVSVVSEMNIHASKVNIFDAYFESESDRASIESNKCVPLQTTYGQTPICIYDPKIDEHVSGSLDKYGTWESGAWAAIERFLKLHPNMQLLDLGCNIGVFTLQAAKMGRTVIAVDANKFNLRLLSKSLRLGGDFEKVTLVNNAISDVRETIQLTITTGNIGGSYVSRLRPGATLKPEYTTQEVEAVKLEDLLLLMGRSPIFIKMDIEGSEWRALSGGTRFLREADVRYVLMEWFQVTNKCEFIRYFFNLGFRPYNVDTFKPLGDDLETWPDNVIWIKE